MHWLALLCPPAPTDEAPAWGTAQRRALAWWALQFTPRVAHLEDAVVLEVASSLRLFGGAARLHTRLLQGAADAGLCVQAAAWAPTSLGALALARCQLSDGFARPLNILLDGLPLHALTAVQAQAAMLARLGCRHLGDVRKLPRAGVGKRFGKALLQALDQAYGLSPEAHDWLQEPAQFQARLELPQRIENAQALLHYARHLLLQLCAWLAARHAGIQQLTLHWTHDSMRAKDAGSGGQLMLRTATLTRDFPHLARLLGEHLAHQTLAAPVGEISLQAGEVLALEAQSLSLLPASPEQAREPLPQLLERLAARLGAEQVRCGQLQEDHRPEAMQRWQAWPGTPATKSRLSAYPQPSWLLTPPLRLSLRQDQPCYQGPLQLLAGPQRIEGGWWQTDARDHSGKWIAQQASSQPQSGHVQRDYFVALSAAQQVLWIFQQRLSADEQGWFLHGFFA
jgi:protein ImuB